MNLFGLKGVTVAAATAAIAFASPNPAEADWACEVALCLANPAGPMAVPECVAPIKRLYKELATGGGFPVCRPASGHVDFVKYGRDTQQDCAADYETYYEFVGPGKPKRRWCKKWEIFDPQPVWPFESTPEWESRVVDGERLWGINLKHEALPRKKQNYLEYIAMGQTHRVWW